MNPLARTAYYCCAVRALDAERRQPICGDQLAQRFMDEEALAFVAPLLRFSEPAVCNAARHRMIDDLLRERLAADPKHLVVLLGAGLDTRAFRLHGGKWVEIDNPEIMAVKEAALPATQSPNHLQRVPIDFQHERLADVLKPWQGRRKATVVMEGVICYLSGEQLRDSLRALRASLPAHRLICDLQTRMFADALGGRLRRELASFGAHFGELSVRPWRDIESAGYRQHSRQSIVERASLHGALWAPPFLLDTVFRFIRDGYTVCEFEAV
ncbi:MAG: class I SAM-dependent methyltransferase [Paucibacter sp.]|nr:class I SAM-dependent methyltransferase [Roseateles sp.]